jgi:hypothetical protein
MADDLERGAKGPYPREWLERVQAALNAEIAKSIAEGLVNFPTLGFDPDYLMFNRTSIGSQMRKEFANNSSALCAFIGSITGEYGGSHRSWSSERSRGKWRSFMRQSARPTNQANLVRSPRSIPWASLPWAASTIAKFGQLIRQRRIL